MAKLKIIVAILALGVLLSVAKSCITTTTWNQRVPASLKSGGSLT